jgi:hypothetical protein
MYKKNEAKLFDGHGGALSVIFLVSALSREVTH